MPAVYNPTQYQLVALNAIIPPKRSVREIISEEKLSYQLWLEQEKVFTK